jgi:hypothetical protein
MVSGNSRLLAWGCADARLENIYIMSGFRDCAAKILVRVFEQQL